ncbi:MAG: pseudouridine synthase [Candidatus Zixiibacteriota bacterium]
MDPQGKESGGRRGERLNRFLARAGVGSRRKADELIAAGRVRLNGRVVEKLATFVDPQTDQVTVDGQPFEAPVTEPIWIALHKLPDTVTTRSDERGRMTIFDGLPKVYSQLITVGRLDRDTTGLILLTNDGEAANRLMHPRYQIERTYEADVVGVPTRGVLHKMHDGVPLGDSTPARAEGEIIGRHHKGATLRLVLREGRKREIKRLCEALGHPVLRLRRVSYAGIRLKGLDPGRWRKLRENEIAALRRMVGLEAASKT